MKRALLIIGGIVLIWLLVALLLREPEAPTGEVTPAVSEAPAAVDLRARIDRLKREMEAAPIDESNMAERGRVLAEWVDELAVKGESVALAAPGARSVAANAATGAAATARARLLTDLYRELLVHDEPGALGSLAAERLGPFTAHSLQTLRQTYTVGSRPIATGGGFWIARHFAADFGPFQTDDPAADGHVTIASSDPDARFAVDSIMAEGAHGGFRGAAPALVFRVAEGTVDAGATVTITYGDTSGGGAGLRMPGFTSERMPLPVYVDLAGDGLWLTLPLQPFVVTGMPVARVHGFAPSVVAPAEAFELTVRAEDALYNRATGAIPAFTVLLDGEQVATTAAGAEAITRVPLSIAQEGAHWITLHSADGALTGEANPILVVADPPRRIFWGDTHGHSGYAEGIGTVDYFMRFARDDARLDFVTHSEHDSALDAAEWTLMRETTARYFEDGVFVPFLGYEWTTPAQRGGHHNVLYRTIDGREPVSSLDHPTLSRLYHGLRTRYAPADVVVIPHAHNPGDYRQSDAELEPLIEIMSMHGNFEWFARQYLNHGHQVGFVAASDDHLSHPGYSAPFRDSLAQRGGLGAVFAESRTRDSIFDALKAIRTYATTGERMILDFQVNGVAMGSRAPHDDTRRITGRVIGTSPIDSIAIVRNDAVIWRKDYLTEAAPAGEGEAVYRLSFRSQTGPYHPGDAPRGWRHWNGVLRVSGAQLRSATPTDFTNPYEQSLSVAGNEVRFRTLTRGDASSIDLLLADVRLDAAVEVELETAQETGSAPPFLRDHAEIPGARAAFPLRELAAGVLERALPFDGFDDAIVLRHIRVGGERDVRFEYIDAAEPRQGDYYFAHVRQANDAQAWSSPVWVGGYPHR